MFPLYADKYKFILFWSYKCGCTFIKHLFYNKIMKYNYSTSYIKLLTALQTFFKPNNQKLIIYKKIYVCRNPYARIVSCFIDKYIHGYFTFYMKSNLYIQSFFGNKIKKFTFKNFIDLVYAKMILKKNNLLEYNHLECQFNKSYMMDKIFKLEDLSKNDCFYDYLNEIDPNIMLETNTKAMVFDNYSNCQKSEFFVENAYDLEYDVLLELKKKKEMPNYKYFYNQEILQKVKRIYRDDFEILAAHGIHYNL